ncbi:Teosinte glume architecture 1 [Zea mays]|uniref:Teosinte glume architecture 1 n=2 Tax=Zea mays TaxID=4577 RepID=A0A3L6F2E9_MAIZE|nr:Teosinte glume architecture 1 [Zea mays]
MDWDLNAAGAWDLAELEQDHAAAAPSSWGHAANAAAAGTGTESRPPAPGAAGAPAECSVDLKLGGMGECEPGAARREREAAAGAAKRPRPAGPGGQQQQQQCPSCAVDGCRADLGKCRDYHRRHKVCEAHSKTPVVVVAGREMRFCQQCSRFHLLAEFDADKRSCRKRLDGHNRRRRKPQPDTMASASFIASQQGTRFSPFAHPRLEASWPPGVMKTEESPYHITHQIPLGSSSSSRQQHFVALGAATPAYAKEGRRFPFLQEGEISFATGVVLEPPAAAPACQPLLRTGAPSESSGAGGSKMFSDQGLARVLDSDCALSLLSAPANSSGIDVSRMVRPTEHVPMAQQPVVPGLQFGSASWFPRPQASTGGSFVPSCPAAVEGEQQLNAVLGPNDSEVSMNYGGMFHVGGGSGGGEGSSDGGTSSSMPFSWQ